MAGMVTSIQLASSEAGNSPLTKALGRLRRQRTPNITTVDVGARLDRLCAQLGSRLERTGITLTCSAIRQQLPPATATLVVLIAERLLAVGCGAFSRGRGGRIAVAFNVVEATLELTVEHSQPARDARAEHGEASSWLVRTLAARLGGRLECPRAIGGVRTVVTMPLPHQ